MGDLDLQTMRDATRWALDNRTNISDPQLDRWINWSYRHVSQPSVYRHTALQANLAVPLVLDVVTYDIQTITNNVLFGIYGVWYVEGASVTDATLRRHRLKGSYDIRSTDTGIVSQGRPTRYSVWGPGAGAGGGQVLNLDRRPSPADVGRVLLVRGYRLPDVMVADVAVTRLAALWDEVIILGATWRGFRELGENARAEVARQNFGLLITEQQDSRKLDAEDWGGAFELDLTNYMPVS